MDWVDNMFDENAAELEGSQFAGRHGKRRT